MLNVSHLTFGYDKTPILKNISFNVKPGEHVSLIGASGSGKTTLLKLIFGAHDLNEGSIYWDDFQILGPSHNLIIGPDFMKYVSQEFDLMLFTSVAQNVGAHLSNFFLEKKDDRINELLDIVGLKDFKNVKVKNLSGGQKQRVALARALAKEPKIILLDEPFSNIDNFKKQELRRRLFKYLKANTISCIVATHDREDVLGFADNMLVLSDAKIIADGAPITLYENPKNALIASFFGEFNHFEDYGFVYAHQTKIVDHSANFKARVTQSYFMGSYYLIEADYNSKSIFIIHSKKMEKGTPIHVLIQA